MEPSQPWAPGVLPQQSRTAALPFIIPILWKPPDIDLKILKNSNLYPDSEEKQMKGVSQKVEKRRSEACLSEILHQPPTNQQQVHIHPWTEGPPRELGSIPSQQGSVGSSPSGNSGHCHTDHNHTVDLVMSCEVAPVSLLCGPGALENMGSEEPPWMRKHLWKPRCPTENVHHHVAANKTSLDGLERVNQRNILIELHQPPHGGHRSEPREITVHDFSCRKYESM